jgi:hypothetical protein
MRTSHVQTCCLCHLSLAQKEKNHMLFDNALFHMRQMDFVPVTSWPEKCMPEVRVGIMQNSQ